MKVIGITGGVGSGKSYVARLAAGNFDVLHIQTDNIAKRQMKKGGASYAGVVEYFGEGILGEDKEIDRARLAQIVFNDDEKLKVLNSLTHPNVTETVKSLIAAGEGDYEACLVETAILKEAGYEAMCDEIWVVTAPKEERIGRLMKDRGYTRERAEATIDAQLSDDEFASIATALIENPDSASDEMLIGRIDELLNQR